MYSYIWRNPEPIWVTSTHGATEKIPTSDHVRNTMKHCLHQPHLSHSTGQFGGNIQLLDSSWGAKDLDCISSIWSFKTPNYYKQCCDKHWGARVFIQLSLYKDVAISLTTFPTLYTSSLWLICFVTGSFYLLISLISFTHWVPNILITSLLKSQRGKQKKGIKVSYDHRSKFREM